MAGYIPGTCNIGKDEIRKRYMVGAAGFVVSVLLAALLLWMALPKLYLLLVFIPLMLGFEGLYQGRAGFCVGFASRGIYNLEGSGGSKGKVEDKKSHDSDMKKAGTINLKAAISALIITILVYLLL